MTEEQAFAQLTEAGLQVERLKADFRAYGFGVYEGEGSNLTFFWREKGKWVWEPKLVVPGPGPLLQFDDIGDLVAAILRQYAKGA